MNYLEKSLITIITAFSLHANIDPQREEQILKIVERYEQALAANPQDPKLPKAIAETYYFLNRHEEAIPYFRLALQYEPNSGEIEEKLGFSYFSVGRLEESKVLLTKALGKDPNNPKILALLGELESKTDEDHKAVEYFEKALQHDPNNIDALNFLGLFYFDQKNYDEAKEIYEKLKGLYPDVTWIDDRLLLLEFAEEIDQLNLLIKKGEIEPAKQLYERTVSTHFELNYFYNFPSEIIIHATRLTEEGKEEEAISIYQKLLTVYPDFNFAYNYLGDLYTSQGRVEDEIELLERASKRFPSRGHFRIRLGHLYLTKNAFKKAQKQFQEALKLAPLDFRAYDGLALIEQNQENFELAEKYYKQALAIDPSYVQAKSNYGTLLLEQKRFAEAEVLYKELQSIDDERLKESPWIKSNYESAKIGPNLEEIKALVDAGKTDLAIAKYEILLKKHPDKTYLYEGLAQLYVEEKEYEKALGVYQSALEIEPDNLDIQAGIGFLYLSTENNVRAKGIFNGILESDPKNVNALAGLGRVEELTENRDKAEYYYKKALDIDPKNIRALALYASLLQEKGSYDEAKSIYGRVLDLTPNAEWAERGFYEAEYSPMLDLAQELIDKGQVQEAKNIYLNLIDLHPENIRYYFLLGQLYTEQEQYESALGVYQSALEIEPDNVNIQLQLGFVYLNIENFLNAENIFAHVLEGNPKNADALTGLGRLQELHKNIERASYYYDEALEVDPVNIRTLSFYADLLLQNKAYEESEAMYARILEIIPNSKWAEDGFYNAKYGPMLDLAINLQKVGREDEAAKIYLELISLRPENTGYYSILGQLYRDMQKYDNAICILLKGLDIDPDALYLWNLIGMIQIDKQELSTAYCIFLYVLEKNPSNVDAWAGLGRLNMLSGKLCRAREYYMRAIHLAKERSEAITPKAFLAELKLFSGYQFQATAISHELMTENPDQEWLFNSFERSYRETRPYLEVTGGYYEENEWDDLLEEFIIRYQVYGTEVDAICPINDCYTFIFDASDEYYVLKEIDEREDLFSLNIVRIHAGMRVVLNDFYQIVTKLGFSNYSPTKLTTFRGETKTLFEPTFNLIYNTPNETALFGFDTETNLVARNFITNRSEIIGRYFVVGRYAREMNKDFTTGFEAMGSVYNDYVKNASYGGSAWLQVTPSTLHDYLSVKYLFGYGGFKDVIPDYFTYKYRFINEIEVSLQKTWKEYLYSSFRYLHGWEMRNTRFAQVIVTPPFIINQPFFIERREYNTMSLNLDYNNNKWRAAIEAFYYRDTTKYTIWSAALTLGGYF